MRVLRAHELDKGEAVNIMKGAIVTADRIMTVSQGYAWEITTPEGEARSLPDRLLVCCSSKNLLAAVLHSLQQKTRR